MGVYVWGRGVCCGLGDVEWCERECGCICDGSMGMCVFGDGGGWMCVRCGVFGVCVCGVA